MRSLYASLTLLFFVSSLAPAAEGYPDANAYEYKTVGDTTLSLHVFNPVGHKPTDSRPAAVFFFGGGWNGGSPTQFVPHCRYLASRGMVAVTADYRVKSRQGTSPRECVKDGKSAVRWLRTNAAKLGIDPDRIAAGGGSAGGHVASTTGIIQGMEEKGEDLNISSKPNALLLFNPVYDNGPDGYGYDRVKDYYQAISPIHNIEKGAPPTIVFLGTKDTLIPVSTAKKFQMLMDQVKATCVHQFYKDEPHGFFNYNKKDNFVDTVTKMDQFLEKLGWLKGEASVDYEAVKP
jgi:acetyl esterase